MSEKWTNKLYYGDNLEILRNHIQSESVDLIYLDPPFNSKATYNILFQEKNGSAPAAQVKAFEDFWHWDEEAERTYSDVVQNGPQKLSDLLLAMRSFLGQNDMMAYLTMMAPRLVELHRVLKSTGSIYLHCDPTASHYIKILLDSIFGKENYGNEIIWKRKTGRGETNSRSNRYGCSTDRLLFYKKSKLFILNEIYKSPNPEYIKSFFKHKDKEGRLYALDNLSSPSYRPNLIYEYKGYKPPKNGWAISKEKMKQWDKEGKLYFPANKNGRIRRKRYLDELPGSPVQDLWDDIGPISSQAQERLGYPTQKPEALLERIIQTSSNEGDLVLDPFCGCGTTIAVSERLRRKWIGIDITHLAIALMKNRLESAFGKQLSPYEIIGDPKDLASAQALADQDKYQFQWWALSLIEARPAGEQKKGADQGVDGYIYFFDDNSGKAKKIIVQVKAGHVTVSQIRDLKGVMEREKAEIGAFITLLEPTEPMKQEAWAAGFYEPEMFRGAQKFPKVQILTIEELLSGKELQCPRLMVDTYKKAKMKKKIGDEQLEIF